MYLCITQSVNKFILNGPDPMGISIRINPSRDVWTSSGFSPISIILFTLRWAGDDKILAESVVIIRRRVNIHHHYCNET